MADTFYFYAQWSYEESGKSVNRILGDGSIEVLEGIEIPAEVGRKKSGARSSFLVQTEALAAALEVQARGAVIRIDTARARQLPHPLYAVPTFIAERDGVMLVNHPVRNVADADISVIDLGGALGQDTLNDAQDALDAQGAARVAAGTRAELARKRAGALLTALEEYDALTQAEKDAAEAPISQDDIYTILRMLIRTYAGRPVELEEEP